MISLSLVKFSNRTVDPEALDAYLQAHFHRERLGPEDQDSALKYFQIAIEKDPDWADPYVGLARVWGVRAAFRFIPEDWESWPAIT